MTKRWGSAGFTIVESLVVIVVIAILAVVVTVAYNGIQQQARTSAITNVVQSWDQAIIHAGMEGFNFPAYSVFCLGSLSDYPETSEFSAGACLTKDGESSIFYEDTMFSEWPSKVHRPPGVVPVTTFMSEVNQMYLKARGIWAVTFPAARTVFLYWIPQNAGQCGAGESGMEGESPLLGSYCHKKIVF